MELKTCKMLVLVLLGVIKLVSGLAPMLITKILRKKNRRYLNSLIGIVLCLGGGVLLSTVFLHILPEVRETLERSSAGGLLQLGEEYPLAELVLCLGFLAIFLMETIVCKLFGLGHSHGHGVGGDSEMSVSVNNSKNNTQGAGRPDDPMVPMVHSHNETTHPSRSMPFIGATQFESDKNVYNVSSATLVFSTSFSDLTLDTISDPPTSPSKYLKRNKFVSSIRSFLVVLALSIHSVFEGMAIGLQENESGVWKLFIAVSVHATAILFCIGMEMISTGMRKLQIVFYVAVLAAVTPIGVAIGIMVSLDVDQSGEGDILVIGILQGVAGGTLLYITFFEVLDREKLAKYKMSGMVGILAILVGFGAMASLEGFGGHSHLEGGHGHVHIDEAHGYDHVNGGHGHVHMDEVHGYDRLNGGHGHVHIDEAHGYDHFNGGHGHDHLNGGHGHVHTDEGHGYDHLNGGHGHVHTDKGHGYNQMNGGHGYVHTDKGHGYNQMNGGRGHGHIHEDHGHIHIVGEQGNDHVGGGHGNAPNVGGGHGNAPNVGGGHGNAPNVGGGHGNAPNVGDHRFDPVREDQGHAHTKDIHGDAHDKDNHGNDHAKDIHGNEPASTEARGDNIGQVVEHEHAGLSFDKASEHEHNVSLEQRDLLLDSNTLGHVHSDNKDFHLEHDDSQVAVHGHNDNIKDGEALNHTHHVDQDVELEHNDHLETAGQVHNNGDSLGLDQIHIQESNKEVEHKLDHLVLMKNPVGKNNSEIEKNNVEQKGEQDIMLSHEILDNDSSHSDRQASLNQVLNEEKNGGNKSEFAEFRGKLSEESMEKSDSNPSNTNQVDDKETMLNDTTKNDNKVISSEDHFIVRDKEGGHGNDSSYTEDNSVLSSLVGQVDNSNQTENETHTKGHNVDSDNEFISDKSQTVVLIDENDRSGAKSDDVTALNTIKLDIITDVHREDTLIIEGENENSTSSNNSSNNNVSYDGHKLKYNQTSNDSDRNPMVHQEVFSNQSKASMNDNTLEEGNVKLNNSEIVDDLNDSFEEVPILNNTSEVFFDYNDFVYNGQEVKGQGDSPPLEIIKDLENDKNETTLVNSDIVFFEESAEDKASKNFIKENVKHDIDSNEHDVGSDEKDNNIDSVKNHVKSDKPQPWWTAFF